MSEKRITPTILIISHVIPFPPAAGNEVRILKMIRWLRKEGFAVVFLLNADTLDESARRSQEGIVDRLHLLGDEYGVDFRPLKQSNDFGVIFKEKLKNTVVNSSLYQLVFAEEHRKRIESEAVKRRFAPDRLIQLTAYLCRKYNPCAVIAEYIFSALCLDTVPDGILKIIDTHDMFSRKKERVISYNIDDPFACTPREERAYLLKCDLVIAIQANEARLFGSLVRERDVITVGVDFEVVPEIDNSAAIHGTILVVGSDNPLNQHGLQEFYYRTWPRIRAGHRDAVLRVVGKLAHHLQTTDERVQLAGWVPDLNEEYRKAEVVINPTMAGTGLKIKSVEALCRAKPFIGTPNSVEGMDCSGKAPYMVCHDWDNFAEAVLMLLKSEDARMRLQRLAWHFARENFSTEKTYAPLGRKLWTAFYLGHGQGITKADLS